jgi:transcriptional regulator with XRE-family HTH domain
MIAEIGKNMHNKRIQKGLQLKEVADYLDINISLLRKIEHGERQIQGYMLKGICELLDLDYKKNQIEFLNQKIENEFGNEPFLKEAINEFSKKLK